MGMLWTYTCPCLLSWTVRPIELISHRTEPQRNGAVERQCGTCGNLNSFGVAPGQLDESYGSLTRAIHMQNYELLLTLVRTTGVAEQSLEPWFFHVIAL